MTTEPLDPPRFTLFETAVGACGVAWGPRGVVGVQLPEGKAQATRGRLLARFPGAMEGEPTPEVQQAVAAIAALVRGEPADLSGIVLDMAAVPAFHRRVYEAARAIPPGSTSSYGEVAARIGSPAASRAVGQALGRNPFAVVVPCHRVLAAGGKVGGFTANGGVTTKLRLLMAEQALAESATAHFEGDGSLRFDPVAAVDHLKAADPAMAKLIDAVGPLGMRVRRTSSVFEALAEAIVYQQLTGKAAATILARVRALFPRPHEGLSPRLVLRASDDKLRGAGLSRAKTLSLRDLAAKAEAGQVPSLAEIHAMDDAAIVERLTQVRGIGRWTVEMILMFRLGRGDVWPVDDYGVRKGYSVAFKTRGVPTAKELVERGEPFRPYRSAAAWYMWRAAEGSKRVTAAKKKAVPAEERVAPAKKKAVSAKKSARPAKR
jgi:methylated-DNA-[protein]-cysteine S-methyltransferase